MERFFAAELLKQKRSFNKILLWLAPTVTILLALLLMRGRFLLAGAYNWWYMLILPGSLTMIAAFTAVKERRKNRHGLFGVAIQKKKLWAAQVLVCTFFLAIMCACFFVLISVGWALFGGNISLGQSLAASFVLFITYAWQIPLWMALADKTGVGCAVFVSLLCNNLAAIVAAGKACWWIPFAIPARMMCVCIHVLPNGLPMEAADPLGDAAVVVPALLRSVMWYAGVTYATARWFEKREV